MKRSAMPALTGSLSMALVVTVSFAVPSPATASALGDPPPDSKSSVTSTSTSTTSSPGDTDTDTDTDADTGTGTDPATDLATDTGTGTDFGDDDDDDDDPRHSLLEQARKKCKPRSFFRFHSLRPRNFFVPRTRFIDGPGGTMTVSVTRQHRVYAEMELERERIGEIDRDDLIRQLRNMVSPLLAEEYIVETGHQYERAITAGKYGNMWYRVFGYRVGFSAWREIYSCRVRKIAAGVANIPARVEGWRYWETDHPMYKGRRLSKR
ncbi:hypothetical protein OG339_45740 [Streptosporangium sp. NBC_01495]|uniref:hypothetical protein n=1 Tax=Streptosporangium sp. NBC_01495 TaxID=2903899 RepID=UPI002E317248|nr:hypothetical protein [Streptosporangium sp. NBC_01495]